MKGKIYEPAKELNEFVMSYWTLDFPKADTPKMNTIIPDGTMNLSR